MTFSSNSMAALSIFPQLTTKRKRVLSQQELPENLPIELLGTSPVKLDNSWQNLSPAKAQGIICRFFLNRVREDSPESVLQEFKDLFIEPKAILNSIPRQALEQIASLGQETTFIHTLKHSVYILINNWSVTRQPQYIQELVQLLSQALDPKKIDSIPLKRLRLWRSHFVNSQDYREVKAFVFKWDRREKPHWSSRYSSYLLVSQAVNAQKLAEQREAARTRYLQLKEQFKFELAMYTARTQDGVSQPLTSPNPTALGDEVLGLIEQILLKPAAFSYASCVRIFLHQTQQLCYQDFKQSLINYLLFSLENQKSAKVIKLQLASKLEFLYEKSHEQTWDNHLLLRTCNRVIEYLTIVNQEEPSSLFLTLAGQGDALTLATLLLKIVLLCPSTATHLECCLARLIQYYEKQSESECQWLIHFLEVIQVTLAIYADNVQYNLVKMSHHKREMSGEQQSNTTRIFSQVKTGTQRIESAA
jgi:hypothetical protein